MSETPDSPSTDSTHLRDATVSGIRWIAASRATSDTVQFAAAIALARLLSPAEFGHAAIALILLPLAAILTFEGFGSALVQRKEITQAHLEAAMLASLVAGVALTALAAVAIPPLAALVFGERTADLIRLASPLFAIAGLSAVARSVLWRRLQFRTASLIEMASLLVTAVASVILAVLGLDAEAMVLGAVCGAVAAAAMFLVTVPPVRPRWRPAELRHILGFGGPASGAGLLHVAITNVDYTILAARLSATQTGFYWRAFQLGVVYQDKISGIFMRLAFPVYSRTKDLEELGRLHARAARVHAAVVVPLLAVLIVVAPALIPFVFGHAWEPAVLPTQILAVAGMVAAVLTGFAQVLLAAGRPKVLLRFNIGVLAVYAGAVFVAAPHGLVPVAISVVGVYLAELAVVYGVLFRRVLGMPIKRMATDLGPAVAGTAALLGTGFPLRGLLESAGAPVPLVVLAVATAGGLVHCAVLRAAFPAAWHDLVALAVRVAPAGLVERVRRLGVRRATIEGSRRPQPEL